MAYDSAHGATLLFGGSSVPCCDTWAFDGRDWSQLRPSDQPPPRSLHAMATDNRRGRVVVFGGVGDSHFLNDTWEWDGQLWLRCLPAHSPSPRAHHAMVFDEARGTCVLFGGVDAGVNLGDTWEWNGIDWIDRAPVATPCKRFDHAMAYDVARQRTVLFGGQTDNTTCSQTWEWDGASWWPQNPVTVPPARLEHAMVYDRDRGVTVLFGGRGHNGILADTWLWNGITWSPVPVATLPPARASHRLVFDDVWHQVVMFGGISAAATPLDDTWAFSPLPFPARHELVGSGCAGSAGVPRLTMLPGGLPWIDESLGLRLDHLPPHTLALLMLGVTDHNQGLLILPAELTSFGMPGCWLYTSIDAFSAIDTGNGAVDWWLDLPARRDLLGLRLHQQAIVLDPAANWRGFTTSNAAVASIGARL